MELLNARVAGLDVHQASVVATVRVPGNSGTRLMVTETFGTMTADLLALRDWLQAYGVTHVALESTGVYWKPVYYILEEGCTLLLINMVTLKHVPGRKTDVKDSEWLAQLLECGLLRASFVPPPPIRELRDLTRYRVQQVRDYWFAGGYPEPWLSSNEEFRNLWHRNYIDTYLLRDIGALFPNLNRDRFRQFVALLSQHSGNILNNADIARTLGVSEPTVRDWLRIAHDTFLWRHIPAWDRSPAKQLVKHPKGYLRDSGLLHRLLRIPDHQLLATHPVVGKSWEGMVVETLLRGFENAGIDVEPFHYRTRGGAEIDLILEGQFGNAQLLPVEIKLTQQGDKRALRSLSEFVAAHDCPLGLVINNDERARWLDERILAIPAACL